MSETKFTPGPWKATGGDPAVEGDYEIETAEPQMSSEGGLLAFVYAMRRSGRPTQTVSANAALIAAAPELYAALDVALASLRHEPNCAANSEWCAKCVGFAALRKARGES